MGEKNPVAEEIANLLGGEAVAVGFEVSLAEKEARLNLNGTSRKFCVLVGHWHYGGFLDFYKISYFDRKTKVDGTALVVKVSDTAYLIRKYDGRNFNKGIYRSLLEQIQVRAA